MFRKFRKKAQSLAEFAMVLPVFVVIICVLIDGAQLIFAKSMTQYASYTGSRAAAVAPPGQGYYAADQAARKNVQTTFGVESPTVSATATAWQKGGYVTVTTSTNVHLFISLPQGSGLSQTFPVHSSITALIER